jgi:hypothetical protein
VHNFLLHQVETHGYERHAQHQIHGAEDEAQLDLLALNDALTRNDVSETNRAQADEAEIGTVQEVPAFPLREQDSTETDVPTRTNKPRGLSPRAKYTEGATAACWRTFVDRGSHVVSVTDPYGLILGLLEWRPYFFFQVAPQLYS